MNITSSNRRFWESPTDYVGKLPTTGKGVGVVIMDQGFDITHADLRDRVTTVATSAENVFDSDPVGHGTLVMGIVGADGRSSDGQVKGVAPDANLIAVKVNLDQDAGWEKSSASVAAGIHWAIQNQQEHNIKVINCSFVLPMVEQLDPDTMQVAGFYDPIGEALEDAHEAGITVVGGTGNFGTKMPIMTPAGNPHVIAVGALNTNGTPEDLSDDSVAAFSSRGKSSSTGDDKPDLLAPGVNIMSTNARGSSFERLNNKNTKLATGALKGSLKLVKIMAAKQIQKGWLPASVLELPEQQLRHQVLRCYEVKASLPDENGNVAYIAQNGTSEAAPIVSGVIANMLEANPQLCPDEVREILFSSARPVQGDKAAQGHGAVNAQAAVAEAARRFKAQGRNPE